MRHANKRHHLGLAADQRKALLRSLARDLILHGQITTTVIRAKALRPYIEKKLLSRAIKSTNETDPAKKLHHIRMIRREVAADIVKPLIEKVQPLLQRPGGYTRIIKMANRRGDNTQLALIQILDN